MARYRIICVLVLTALFMLAAGLSRPATLRTGVPQDKFWADKYDWPSQYDVVTAGCSRMTMGLSPAAMKEALPGYRIANFGFISQVYTTDYLQATARLLDPQSRQKAIVFGVGPLNFLRGLASRGRYTSLQTENPIMRWLNANCCFLSEFSRPYDYRELNNQLRRQKNGEYQVYHSDGWIAAHRIPEKPEAWLPESIEHYKREKVNPKIIDNFIINVKDLTSKGVAVFALRIPTTVKMLELENRCSGFNESDFQARFEAAGGVWLSFPIREFHSYDGSHLREDSAKKLSVLVAEAVSSKLNVRSAKSR